MLCLPPLDTKRFFKTHYLQLSISKSEPSDHLPLTLQDTTNVEWLPLMRATTSRSKLYILSAINTILMFWHTKWLSWAFAYLDPKKYIFKPKLFYVNLLFPSVDPTMYKTSNFVFFCPWKLKKKTLKSKILLQNGRIFQYCHDGPISPTTAKVQDSFKFL